MLYLSEVKLDKDRERPVAAKSALFAATLIWGSSFVIVKDVTNVWSPGFLLAARFTVAFALLCLIFYKKLKTVNKDYLLSGSIIGVLLFLAYYTQTVGITDTTPGKNAFLSAGYCVLVPFLFWLVNKTRPGVYNLVAAALCITGIGLVSLTEHFTIGFGDALTLVCSLFFALHIVFVAKLARDKDPWLIATLQFGAAAVCSWLVVAAEGGFPADFSLPVLGGVLYLSIFCTAVALSLQNFGQKYTNPSAAALVLCLEAVFGVIFSVVFYHEALTAKIVAGFVLILVSIIVSELGSAFMPMARRRAERNKTPQDGI